jgi:hypothetical protein
MDKTLCEIGMGFEVESTFSLDHRIMFCELVILNLNPGIKFQNRLFLFFIQKYLFIEKSAVNPIPSAELSVC